MTSREKLREIARILKRREFTSDQKVILINMLGQPGCTEIGPDAEIIRRTGLTERRYRKAEAPLREARAIQVFKRKGYETEYWIDFANLRNFCDSFGDDALVRDIPGGIQ